MKQIVTNGHKKDCGFADEIVSYIYDEIGGAERLRFETHLADCSPCTDEFAAVSNARFSVFEWQKEEFAHLSTPKIVIPCDRKSRIVEDAPAGFLAGLRGLFGTALWPSAVAASLLFVLGLGFVVLNFTGTEQQIAANINVPPVAPAANLIAVEKKLDIKTDPAKADSGATDPPKIAPDPQDIRPIRVAENRQPRLDKLITAETKRPKDNIPQKPVQQDRKAPVLSNYDDNEDKSLRLSDLFDEEVGASL